MSLTAVVLTYNEETHIAECLNSLHFADARLVFDSFSADRTADLAREAGAIVQQRRFDNYALQRNAALAAVASEWTLFVDADERVTPELAAAIAAVTAKTDHAAFRIPRHNYIFGRLTLGAGWYPDYQTRLLRTRSTHYDPARPVHEVVIYDGTCGTLEQPLIHHNYRDVRQFHAKQRRYTAYAAEMLYADGTRPKPQNYVLQPLRHFWWRFVALRGFTDGAHGLRLSALMAWYELQTYLLLRRLWANAGRTERPPRP